MRNATHERSLTSLGESLAHDERVRRLFEIARDEDLGDRGDLTSACWFDTDEPFSASVVMREDGIVAGLACLGIITEVFTGCASGPVRAEPCTSDGSPVRTGDVIASLHGNRSAVVGIERTILNTIGRLSGIATLTAQYVSRARAGNPAVQILDTRKTTPGLRALEKYAVHCGGGTRHRMGLHDAVLVKDNHIAGLTNKQLIERARLASRRARKLGTSFVEIEVDSLDQFDALLSIEPGTIGIVLLDNMPTEQLREAVTMRNAQNSALLLEASGGVRLDTIEEIASTGVDRISVGALTHSAASLDIGLDLNGR